MGIRGGGGSSDLSGITGGRLETGEEGGEGLE